MKHTIQLIKYIKENGGFKYTTNYEEKKITFHEYLTLSSIVESEMKNVTDKSRYISVLLNRIENNPQIALNSDATVRYANKKTTEALSDKDYKNDSKYNTYAHKGLPIGPICNISDETARTTVNPQKQIIFTIQQPKRAKYYYLQRT